MISRTIRTGISFVLIVVLAACEAGGGDLPAGGAGGACYPNQTCNAGFACHQGVCVPVASPEDVTGGGADGSAVPACATPEDCARGWFCAAGGQCGQQACGRDQDCPGVGLVCLLDTGLCSALECYQGAAAGAPGGCPVGQACNRGTCLPWSPPPPTDVTTPPGRDQIDPPPADQIGPPPADQIDPPGPDQIDPPGSGMCGACAGDDDCEAGLTCEGIAPGAACLAPCGDDGDCSLGWVCYELTAEGKHCVPVGFDCGPPCLRAGCAAGEVCDQLGSSATYGQCIDVLPECADCSYDWLCGEGARCATTSAGQSFCVATCADGACPGWAACRETEADGAVCLPRIPTCCGPDCEAVCDPPCAGATSVCWNGLCVECADDADCDGSTGPCDPTTHTCMGLECEGTTPYEHDGTCVECLEDDTCAEGSCGADHQCRTSGDACGAGRSGLYPACAVINGVAACVPCTEDAHCDGGTCDTATYRCSNAGAESCNQSCVTSGCPSGTAYTLACDPESGCCYDTNGSCDNVVAFCREQTGSECVSVLEMFSGGSSGIPGLPGGEDGQPAGGMCSCDATASMLCGLMPDSPGCEGAPLCYDGLNCMGLGTIMELLVGLGGGGVLPGAENLDVCLSYSLLGVK